MLSSELYWTTNLFHREWITAMVPVVMSQGCCCLVTKKNEYHRDYRKMRKGRKKRGRKQCRRRMSRRRKRRRSRRDRWSEMEQNN